MTKTPRPTQPRRWTSLAIASVTLAATPAFADMRAAPITLAPSEARLWLAQEGGEGGEAGEAGITADATNDVAYLAEITIIEGHMLAARDLYAKGQKADAVALSSHPQEEGTLAELVKQITGHGAADPSDAIAAFTATMAKDAPQAEVDAALAVVSEAFAAAAAVEADEISARFDAVVLVLKAAAGEYEGRIENGAVADVMAWHEAYSFTQLAGLHLAELASLPQSAEAATKASAILAETAAAFGDPTAATLLAGDPAILASVAAKVELLASSVR